MKTRQLFVASCTMFVVAFAWAAQPMVLSLEETKLWNGWNCGAWFVHSGIDMERITFVPNSTISFSLFS